MNFDYVEFLKDYIKRDNSYQRYLDATDESYFDEYDYFCIKLCSSIDKILEENQIMKYELNKGDVKNDKDNEQEEME